MVDAFAVARDILPVGSVVRLEGADALVMVMGFRRSRASFPRSYNRCLQPPARAR